MKFQKEMSALIDFLLKYWALFHRRKHVLVLDSSVTPTVIGKNLLINRLIALDIFKYHFFVESWLFLDRDASVL